MLWPLTILHVFAATVGLLSGFLATALRKGSGWHGAAGTVFFVSMLTMASSAAYMAGFLRPNKINVVASLLTLYLVATARRAARRRDGTTDLADRVALLFGSGVSAAGFWYGLEAATSPNGMKDGIPAVVYFVFGSIALLCAVSDVRMLRHGGVVGGRRIARHLLRMSGALLIATMSLYPGQARLFPLWLRETNLLFTPHVLLVGSMVFWTVRVRGRMRARQDAEIGANSRAIPDGVLANRGTGA